jgi:hypothetical protein
MRGGAKRSTFRAKVKSIALSFYLGFAVADQSVVERLAIQLVNT